MEMGVCARAWGLRVCLADAPAAVAVWEFYVDGGQRRRRVGRLLFGCFCLADGHEAKAGLACGRCRSPQRYPSFSS